MTITALDLAWERINALGGYVSKDDPFGNGINHTVEQALSIIEELGGCDPLPKRRAAAVGDRDHASEQRTVA